MSIAHPEDEKLLQSQGKSQRLCIRYACEYNCEKGINIFIYFNMVFEKNGLRQFSQNKCLGNPV